MIMSDYSSSSDEDTAKFRAACDPTLELGKPVEEEVREGGHCFPTNTSLGHDTRPTFILLSKIQQAQASQKGRGDRGTQQPRTAPTTGVVTSKRLPGKEVQSDLAPYVARQLAQLLSKTVEVKNAVHKPESDHKDDPGVRCGPLLLLSDVTVDSRASSKPEGVRHSHNRGKRLKNYNYYDSSDEEEMKVRCEGVAVDPERILDQRDEWPQPHPKNVRYLERYCLQTRRKDGSLVATLCPDPNVQQSKLPPTPVAATVPPKTHTTPSNRAVGGVPVTDHALPQLGRKRRKQSSKRSKKKKKNKLNVTVNGANASEAVT